MRIPTLLGITLLITAIASGFMYYFFLRPEAVETDAQISDLQVVNVSGNSATVIWQTSVPVIGKVMYSQSEPVSQEASDNRDRGQSKPRTVHFVTLSGLNSNTRYVFKIQNDSTIFEKTSEFRTASAPEAPPNELTFSFIKPLKGTILNTNLNPVDESLVFVIIPGAQPLATFSSTSGNFIMPLKKVFNKELTKVLTIEPGSQAEVMALKGTIKSNVKITISDETMNLPPIPLGTNLDLENFESLPMKTITFNESKLTQSFDFNNDQKINSLDLAILREATNPRNAASIENTAKYDLNLDGIVDKSDVDLFSKKLTGN